MLVYFLRRVFFMVDKNLHKQKHFLNTRFTCFVFYYFFSEMLIKKNYLLHYDPINTSKVVLVAVV